MAVDDHKLRGITSIVDLRPGMKNVTCTFIVIDKGTTNQTKDGSVVRKCRVADGTGSIIFSLWNEQADAIEEGDILRLIKGYASLWKGSMVLYSGKYGILEKIGEFTMVYNESPDMSDTSHDFVAQTTQQQHSRGQPVPTPSRWAEDRGNTRMGPGLNRNGNNHIRSDPESHQNGATYYPPSEQCRRHNDLQVSPQPKPLLQNFPNAYRTRLPPTSQYQEPYPPAGPEPRCEGYDYSSSYRERDGLVARHRTEYHKERFNPYTRPPGFVPSNLRERR